MKRILTWLSVLALSACGGGITSADDAQIEATTSTIGTHAMETTTVPAEMSDVDDKTTTTSDPDKTSSDVKREPAQAPERVPTDEVPPDLVATIVADAAQQAGVAEADVVVSMARAVDWPDASLGCPQLGMSYAQVVTPGYQVQVSAGGAILDYRADAAGPFFLCEQTTPVNDSDLPGDEGIDPPPPEG